MARDKMDYKWKEQNPVQAAHGLPLVRWADKNGQGAKPTRHFDHPTNVAGVHLVMGCPKAVLALGWKKKPIFEQPTALYRTPNVDPISLISTSCWCGSNGTNIGWAAMLSFSLSLSL